jgi:hypothetical protein
MLRRNLMQTERLTVLLSPSRKAIVAQRAAARGISVGEYARRRFDEDEDLTPEQEAEMAALVDQVNEAIPRMTASLDEMRVKSRETHREVDRMLREMGAR